MTWVKVAEREVTGVRVYHETPHEISASVNGLCIPGDNYLGKHIRVTIEADISACCEKWRALTVMNNAEGVAARCFHIYLGPNLMTVQGPVEYCPGCGKKLQGGE